jgi:hypothetical protein
MDTSWDEYDAYDLSEFSAADFCAHRQQHIWRDDASHNNRATAPEEDNLSASLCQSTVPTPETHGMLVIISGAREMYMIMYRSLRYMVIYTLCLLALVAISTLLSSLTLSPI